MNTAMADSIGCGGVPPLSAPRAHARLALVVDDSPCLAEQLTQLLAAVGLQAHVPRDPDELRALAPQAALICIELEQFEANGFDLARELSAVCTSPLVLVSGTGRSSDLQWGLRAGAGAVLRRPLTEAALRAALAHAGLADIAR